MPPSPEQSVAITGLSAEQLLTVQINTQRHLPKSCMEQTMNMLAHMGVAMEDASLTTEQRRALRILFYLAPRFLWPEPQRAADGRLAPHARPNLLKQRLVRAHAGEWLQLLQTTLAAADGGTSDITQEEGRARSPASPGLIDERALRSLGTSAQRNQVGTAWKHLWSYGVPAKDRQTQEFLQAKLGGSAGCTESPPPPCPTDQGLALLARCTDQVWQLALKSFTRGKCPDGLGWSQDVFHLAATHAATCRIVKASVLSMLMNEGDQRVQQLLGHSRIIPLYESASHQLRPISVPTTWRKCAGAVALGCWKVDLMHWMGEKQYGAGRSHGSSLLAARLSDLLQEKPEFVHLHLDIRDAFTSLRRTAAWNALNECNAALAASQWTWLFGPNTALIPSRIGRAVLQPLHQGIAQGDPMSSFCFAATLELCVRDFIARAEALHVDKTSFEINAYVDDTVLSVAPEAAEDMLTLWSATLQDYGLQIQGDKTQVFQKNAEPQALADRFHLPLQACRSDGFVLCGLPLPLMRDRYYDGTAVPIGSRHFQKEFLRLKYDVLLRQCAALETIATGLLHTGVHVSVDLLRRCVIPKTIHLMRGLPPAVMHPWCESVDLLFQLTWRKLVGFGALSHTQWNVVCLPASYGGLGLLRLKDECPIHALSQQLALRALRIRVLDPDSPELALVDGIWESVSERINVEMALRGPKRRLMNGGHPHATRSLRRAYYDSVTPDAECRTHTIS